MDGYEMDMVELDSKYINLLVSGVHLYMYKWLGFGTPKPHGVS
jgi:hypothetical protein